MGGVVSALMRFIHPSEHIWNKYPNPLPSQHLENCKMICQEVKNVSQRDQLTLVMHHEEFKHADGTFIELYTIKRYWNNGRSTNQDLWTISLTESRISRKMKTKPKTHSFPKLLMITLMVKFTSHKQL